MGFDWGSFFQGTGVGVVQGGTTLGTALMEAPQRRENLRKTKLEIEMGEQEKSEKERKREKSSYLAYMKKLLAEGKGLKVGEKRVGIEDTGEVAYREPTEEEVKARVDVRPELADYPEPEKLAYAKVPVFGKKPKMEDIEREVTPADIEAAAYDVSPEVGAVHRRIDIFGEDVQRKREQFEAQLQQRYAALNEARTYHDMQAQIALMGLDRKKAFDRFLFGKGTKDTEIKEYATLLNAQRNLILNKMIDLADTDPSAGTALEAELSGIESDLREAIKTRTKSIKEKPPGAGGTYEFGAGVGGTSEPGMDATAAAAEVERLRGGIKKEPVTQTPPPMDPTEYIRTHGKKPAKSPDGTLWEVVNGQWQIKR